MLVFLSSVLAISLVSQRVDGLPKFTYKPAVTIGQREIILGPVPQPDTVMEVRFDNDVPAQIGEGRIAPPSWFEYAKGYVRWSVTPGTLFEKPCYILKTDGTTKGENRTKTKKIGYACENTTTWWIAPTGKLMRQSVTILDPLGRRHAEAVFWPDRIEVSVSDTRGNRSFTLYPNVDLALLDAQFKPMMEGDKVILSYKEYYTFDPFTQAFTKFKASVSGTFHGTWLGTKFEGIHVDIEGPKDKQVAFMSKESDLIKVELPEHTAIVLNFLPHSRDPIYKKLEELHKTQGKG